MTPNMRETLQWLRDRGVIVGFAPLDCGHPPSTAHEECTTGYATTPDGKRICYSCADERTREQMRTSAEIVLYLSGNAVTTWTGGNMGRVTSRVPRALRVPGSYGKHTRIYLNVIDLDGKRWHGTSPGDGMYCRLHATRSLPQQTTKRGV